jgi:hypothetical protein
MRQPRNIWIYVGVIVVVLILGFFLSNRESFASSNPIPTAADIASLSTNPTDVMNQVIDWTTKILTRDLNQQIKRSDSINLLEAYFPFIPISDVNTLVSSYSTKPSPNQFVIDMLKVLKINDPTILSNSTTDVYNKKGTDGNISTPYYTYSYLFGEPTSNTPNQPTSNTPCQPQFKSIPGGTMESKCFGS